jgi:hypothetical protein
LNPDNSRDALDVRIFEVNTLPSGLSEFADRLAAVIGRPSNLRPFICEGSPFKAEVFIVGYNPATRLEGDWWKYWDPDYGYRKSDWLAEYSAQRGKLSKTRAKIEDILAGLKGYAVLEANIEARPSTRKTEYRQPLTAPFDLLMSVCQPRVIIAHGVDAVRHLQPLKDRVTLIECPHFIFVGRARTDAILAQARRALNTEQGHSFE